MKKIIWMLMSVFLLFGCSRSELRILGNYSYKLSGEVQINESGNSEHVLVHKNGQMNIVSDKNNKSELIIMMNEINGACYSISATMKGDSLFLNPYSFSTNILTTNSANIFNPDENASIVYSVNSEGKGFINGDFLIIDEKWTGTQSGNNNVKIQGLNMKIVAEKN